MFEGNLKEKIKIATYSLPCSCTATTRRVYQVWFLEFRYFIWAM
jgi:hypothetical protein